MLPSVDFAAQRFEIVDNLDSYGRIDTPSYTIDIYGSEWSTEPNYKRFYAIVVGNNWDRYIISNNSFSGLMYEVHKLFEEIDK
jgi:hypothetical protein